MERFYIGAVLCAVALVIILIAAFLHVYLSAYNSGFAAGAYAQKIAQIDYYATQMNLTAHCNRPFYNVSYASFIQFCWGTGFNSSSVNFYQNESYIVGYLNRSNSTFKTAGIITTGNYSNIVFNITASNKTVNLKLLNRDKIANVIQ
jgi:hypothetical protein